MSSHRSCRPGLLRRSAGAKVARRFGVVVALMIASVYALTVACADSYSPSADSGSPRDAGRFWADDAAGAAPVGAPCIPRSVPMPGFISSEVYIESVNLDCVSRTCIVDRLEGDPRPSCDPEVSTCPSASEVRDRVYCSCHCRDLSGRLDCACPTGFSCVDVLLGGEPDVAGGYCMRNRTR